MDKPRRRWGPKGLIFLSGLYYVAFIGRVLDLRICIRIIVYFFVLLLYFACATNQLNDSIHMYRVQSRKIINVRQMSFEHWHGG